MSAPTRRWRAEEKPKAYLAGLVDANSTGWKSRLGTAALVVAGFTAFNAWWVVSTVLLGAGVVLLRSVPGWWRSIPYGAVGGLAAGVLILAPGFRLAMRVVALLEPQTTGLSLGGSLVILLAVGGLLGISFGVLGALARFGWPVLGTNAWAVPAGLVMLILLFNDDLRGELFDLGAGAWMNIPMFGLVAAVYGWLAMRVVARFDSRPKGSQPEPSLSGALEGAESDGEP